MSELLNAPWLWSLLGAAGCCAAVAALVRRRDERVATRIDRFEQSWDGNAAEPAAESVRQPGWIQWFAPRRASTQKQLSERLMHAGFMRPSAVPMFLGAQWGLAAGCATLAAWGGRIAGLQPIDGLLMTLIAAGAGFLLPTTWLRIETVQRQRTLVRSLPDFLDLLVACLDSGLSLEGSIQRITFELEQAHPLLGQELNRVQREIELGATPDRALQSFADRADLESVRMLATVCSQSRRFGTRVSNALRGHADAMRQQREEQAEEAAQRAAVKILLPTLLLLFPATFIVLAGPAAIQISERFVQQDGEDVR
ncbi:MAG: type II secretion system F family protein [Planctomyces sp.]|nr:type II secretion system F family protein [Planctomyces sp.]